MRRAGPLLGAFAAVGVLLAAADVGAAGRYDARLRFRVLRTAHFAIYYHQGEEAMARRLAVIAEQVRTDLSARTGLAAPRDTHVVLVDQSDIANGWSTPVPYNLIEIAAIPPPPSSFLGYHDDWLRMVFAHEFAHVLHLDQVGGVMKAVRWVLGRSPASFPNLFVPQWQVEGFATWAESAMTGLGRVHAADVHGVLAAQTAIGRASIDRAGGGLVAWPSGHAPYFQGGTFDQFIAASHSPKALGDITRGTARRIPFLGAPAYSKVLGRSASDVWRVVFATPATPSPTQAPIPRRLTHDGFAVSGPRVGRPSGTATDGPVVYFSSQGPHRFPDIRATALTGGPTSHVTSRYSGQGLSSHGDWLFYDQLEFDGAVAIVSDLYARDLVSGRVERLTFGARLSDPDVDATGVRLAAVQAAAGETRVVVGNVVRSATGVPALSRGGQRSLGAEGCRYSTPRWAPDGARLAAVRQCAGSLPVIVQIQLPEGTERVLAEGGRNVTPTWSADGREVWFASDRDGGRFRLYAAQSAPEGASGAAPRLLLDAAGGVMWPDLDEASGTLVFTSLTADGYDVFAAPLPSAARPEAPEQPPASTPPALPPSRDDGDAGAVVTKDGTYSPWKTLLPRNWSPQLTVNGDDVDVGASVGASDALGYHEYALSTTWRVSGRRADIEFGGAPVSWSVSYAYNRWRPSLLLSAWSALDTVGVVANEHSDTWIAEERSRGAFAGVVIPWRRIRVAQSWLAGAQIDERTLPAEARVADRSRNGLRAGWVLNTSRQYGYSISPEDGIWTSLNVERVTTALGADGDATSVTWDWRGYAPGFGQNHVAAVRVGLASSTGEAAMRRTFDLGGAGVPAVPFVVGQRAVGLLRGLPHDEREGAAVLVANADYRFPLARVERGIRTWPFFLRDIHGAAFADIGSAGDTLGSLPAPAWSIGGEVAARITLGYTWNLSLAAGAAWVRDPARPGERNRAAAYVRTGYAF